MDTKGNGRLYQERWERTKRVVDSFYRVNSKRF